MRAANMEVCVALQARHTSAVVGLAKLADLVIPKSVCTNSFDHVEAISIAELHLRMPERAVHMDPVVICSTLEWLAGNNRSTFFLLSDAVFFFRDVD
jgi:hypothetical protein